VELGVIVMEMNVEMGVEMVMLKRLVLLVFLSIPNFLLHILSLINLNLLFNLSLILVHYNL
jgi:hypothetical protein